MWPPANETILPADEVVVKQRPIIRCFTVREIRVRQMIEAVAAILGLFSAGVFVAHAVDAYRAP